MTLDILINGERVDILSRSSINLRLNNVLYNPTEINSKLAEYSFSFNLPTTPNNNRIFGYANVLAKDNKFGTDYKCEVYSDEILIFSGTLRLTSIQKGFYNVNLVNIKINSVESIFGEMKMNEIDWKIPFDGTSSINTYNADATSKVIFPLVSYGAFQKSPYSNEYEINKYTSKFLIDKYNKWYYESFVPSPNLVELVKKAFTQKGYYVQGDVFQDEVLNNIYISENLANDLIPLYNIGNQKIGYTKITTLFDNTIDKNTDKSNFAPYIHLNLSFPYLPVYEQWNWDSINVYDLWSNENSYHTVINNNYSVHDNCIVIPASGLYKVYLYAQMNVPTDLTKNIDEYYVNLRDVELHTVQIGSDITEDMPVEIQLIRNSDECELIHGSSQWNYNKGDRSLKVTWDTAYPHENLYTSDNPTVTNAQYSSTFDPANNRYIGQSTRKRKPTGTSTSTPKGYMPRATELLAYDPWVNPNFIMGITSIGGGYYSVIKNGYSWNPSCADKNSSRYNCSGYYVLRPDNTFVLTEFNKNTLTNSPNNLYYTANNAYLSFVQSVIWLNKDDILSLKAIIRGYLRNNVDSIYHFYGTTQVIIEPYSPVELVDPDWDLMSLFDQELLIGNFLNKETKVSDFILNFIKEFNLEYRNEGKNVYINKQNFDINAPKYCVNIDNRVNTGETSMIEYPGSMLVKYRIDTEEWGFETTVPPDKLNDPNWKDYGNYGSNKIKISDFDTEEEIQLSTSYTYYDDFKVLDENDAVLGTINIPVISKYSYMIDGYNYEDSMKVDGKGLPLRYWFRGENTGIQVKVNEKDPVNIYDTKNTYKGIDLSYYNNQGTLLSHFFNIKPTLGSNYVSVKCYLTSDEYTLLKRGSNVLFDSDVYIVGEIRGYDPSGINTTELILIKK